MLPLATSAAIRLCLTHAHPPILPLHFAIDRSLRHTTPQCIRDFYCGTRSSYNAYDGVSHMELMYQGMAQRWWATALTREAARKLSMKSALLVTFEGKHAAEMQGWMAKKGPHGLRSLECSGGEASPTLHPPNRDPPPLHALHDLLVGRVVGANWARLCTISRLQV